MMPDDVMTKPKEEPLGKKMSCLHSVHPSFELKFDRMLRVLLAIGIAALTALVELKVTNPLFFTCSKATAFSRHEDESNQISRVPLRHEPSFEKQQCKRKHPKQT